VHDVDAVHDGGLVLRYHLLWELTHVCFEHPGLLRPVDAVCTDEVCITCSDEGRVGEVVTVGAAHDATVRVAGGLEPVDVTLVAPVHPGELVLVHAGTAIALLEDDHG
jgi:hydrogenase maturation factor